jgi:hypothetical protein
MHNTETAIQAQLSAANAMATQLISIAEGLFGSMCSLWSYRGVIFRDHPPHLYYEPDTRSVFISLSQRAIDDELQRDFQLAHEVCHLLYPSVESESPSKPETTVINEGISTYFSVIVVSALHGEESAHSVIDSLATHSPNYFSAFQHVSALLRMDQDAIKKIRGIQPMINKVREADIRASGLPLADEAIKSLVAICPLA